MRATTYELYELNEFNEIPNQAVLLYYLFTMATLARDHLEVIHRTLMLLPDFRENIMSAFIRKYSGQ